MNVYIARDGESLGPYDESQIREYLSTGIFTSEDLGCLAGDDKWRMLCELLPEPLTTPEPRNDLTVIHRPTSQQSNKQPRVVTTLSRSPSVATRRAKPGKEAKRSWRFLAALGWLAGAGLIACLVVVATNRSRFSNVAATSDPIKVISRPLIEPPTIAAVLSPVIEPSPTPMDVPTPDSTRPPESAPTPDSTALIRSAEQFKQAVALSKKRAMQAHPALGFNGSHFNTAFVARYQQLTGQHNKLLQKPDWPEKLADDCARELPAAFQ